MARKRKNRTHLKGDPTKSAQVDSTNAPKSFIIKHGQVGSSLTQLVRDMRKVMEPNTATRLRERTRNKLKDYLTMAPALSVTHLLAFTLTSLAPSLRIVRLTSGPTFSFRIERYSLSKDVLNASRRKRSIGLEYLSPPLLVLAAFPAPSPTTPPHLALLVKFFQSLFPPLSPKSLALSTARRVVLISYNSDSGTINFRHYLISVKPYGVSRRVRRLLDGQNKSTAKGSVLNLGNEKDVADFVLRRQGEPGPGGDGYESAASTSGGEDGEEAISLADDYVGRNNRKGQKRAVRLDEIGPRMELRLVKIMEGVPGREGGVLHHEFIRKSKKEVQKLEKEHREKEKLRKERREEQERNVKRKKELSAVSGGAKNVEEEEEEEGMAHDDEEIGDANDEDEEDQWDENEEISDGEDGGDAAGDRSAEDSESDEEPQTKRPRKKVKFRNKG